MRIPDSRTAVDAIPVCASCSDDDVVAFVRAEVVDGRWSVAADASAPERVLCRRCERIGPLRWSDELAASDFVVEDGAWWARRAGHALVVEPTGELRGYRMSLLARWRSGPVLEIRHLHADTAQIACEVADQWGSSLSYSLAWARRRPRG